MATIKFHAERGAIMSPLRMATHNDFDRLWKSGRFSRDQAYAWLAIVMDLSARRAHIKQFNVAQCIRLRQLVARELKTNLNLYQKIGPKGDPTCNYPSRST